MGAKQINGKPQVFEYSDYRAFLADLYRFLKNETHHFSYRYFSKKAGFKSPNFLKLVIEGQRNLSEKSCGQFCKALNLSLTESRFFCHLVNLNQAKNSNIEVNSAHELQKILKRKKIFPLQQAQLRLYTDWFTIPIREMIATKNFQSNEAWIAAQFQPQLSLSDVKNSIETLMTLELIGIDQDGNYYLKKSNLNTGNKVASSLVANYHKTMIQKGSESIDNFCSDQREISAVCMSVSKKGAEKIKQRIQELREEILLLSEEDSEMDCVSQLNIQFFPLIKTGGESK